MGIYTLRGKKFYVTRKIKLQSPIADEQSMATARIDPVELIKCNYSLFIFLKKTLHVLLHYSFGRQAFFFHSLCFQTVIGNKFYLALEMNPTSTTFLYPFIYTMCTQQNPTFQISCPHLHKWFQQKILIPGEVNKNKGINSYRTDSPAISPKPCTQFSNLYALSKNKK